MAVENQLGMSDEEFIKQNLGDIEDQLEAAEAANLQEEPEEITASEEEQTSNDALSEDADQEPNQEAPDTEIEASESNSEESEEETSDDEVTDPGEEVPLEAETSEDTIETEPEDTDDVAADTETVETKETAEVDFEAAYKRITSPFKASKRMMQVDNVDDAIALMQKGADYHNKMKTIAPHLKMGSMLEKEGLLDQVKLNNLIDISKKDPKAIAQLIKDSGIDPLDIDTDEEVGYKPNNYGISDK